ncbi:FAD-dependent oxidoreductase [Streptomyces candidus]|uniref:Assimilatory nitrate reductase electron transfer subunit n=1 Tax=Streptomyces candidus TaxID=67283 RepID=A0A7X0HNC2_9ACTN|nr:FAD-dependent oxidoreductase [Streptomyces candidus]MBB6439522.1 assimilatory nitrate reductase electron transfer subunit [Streptomyces candidus]
MTRTVIVGNGRSGRAYAARLAERGDSGPLDLLGAEPGPVLPRALLSSVLSGELPPHLLRSPPLPPPVTEYAGVPVTSVDRRRRVVVRADGREFPYDRLVLATGSVPSLPSIAGPAGARSEGVAVLRSAADVARIPPGTAVVLGGGPLAVEAAFALRRAGRTEVALVHRGPWLLDRHLPERAGRALAGRLSAAGVEVHLEQRAESYHRAKLALADGRVLSADALLPCTGTLPESRLAREAGLPVRTGVLTDPAGRTTDSAIHAIGSCVEPLRPRPGGSLLRLRADGEGLLSFGSLADAEESVVLTDPARHRYAALALRAGRVAGAAIIGFPHAVAAVTGLHDSGAPAPRDLLPLLLGSPAVLPTVADPLDAVLCHCNNVTGHRVAAAWRQGAQDLPALVRATRATTGCGGCADEVRALYAVLKAERSDT